MKKLKDILLEAYAWERIPGKPLPTLAEVQAEYQRKREDKTGSAGYGKPSKSGAKPDFLDLDKDGNEEESMKDAADDMENMKEGDDENHGVSVPKLGVEPYDEAYEDPTDAMNESFWNRVKGNLHGHEYILREAFRK